MNNEKREQALEKYYRKNVGEYTRDVIFPPKVVGRHTYYGTITGTKVEQKTIAETPMVKVSLIVSTSQGVIEPNIAWWFNSNDVRAGKKESPRETGFRVNWCLFSGWLRRLTGKGLSDYSEANQEKIKVGIFLNKFGKNYDGIEIPSFVGKHVKAVCDVSINQYKKPKKGQLKPLDYEWDIVEVMELDEMKQHQQNPDAQPEVKKARSHFDDDDEVDDGGLPDEFGLNDDDGTDVLDDDFNFDSIDDNTEDKDDGLPF